MSDVRVRGVVLTPDKSVLLIKTDHPGQTPHWVFPGGVVEPEDRTPVDALRRELSERIRVDAVIRQLIYVSEPMCPGVYLAETQSWPPADPPPHTDADRYVVVAVPLVEEELLGRSIKLAVVAGLLLQWLGDPSLIPEFPLP